MERLAQSIKADGVMQPVLVRPPAKPSNGEGETYELIAGERRWRAAKIAGLTHIPALIRSLDNQQVAEFALIENLQREDLNPLERAHAFAQLMSRFNLSHDQIADRVGVERSTISNSLRLLTLCLDVQELLRQGVLSAGQAKALAGITDPQQQALLAAKAVRGEWSVRQVEAAVRNLTTGSADPITPTPPKQTRATHLADLEVQISQQLGTKVRLRPGRKKGSGSLTIDFYSLDQFDALMTRLGVQTE